MMLWRDRRCSYLWYDWGASAYRVSGCSEMGSHDADQNAIRFSGHYPHPEVRDDGRPWYEEGQWRAAFPYLPLARETHRTR